MKTANAEDNALTGIVEDLPQAPTQEELDRMQVHLAQIDMRYGDGLDYERGRIEGEIRTHYQSTCLSMLETGKRLIQLKEHEGHGHFMNSLERIGIEWRTAKNMMNAATKFIDENGQPKMETVSILGITKLYALAQLDDDAIDELVDGGEVAGLSLEEVKKMTTTALREKMKELKAENTRLKREAKQDRETQESILADKNKRIDELDGKLRAVTDQSRWGEKAEAYLNRLNHITVQANQSMTELAEILTGVEEMDIKEWEGSQEILFEHIKNVIGQLTQQIEVVGSRTDFLAPKANSAFHTLHDLHAVRADKEEEPELV